MVSFLPISLFFTEIYNSLNLQVPIFTGDNFCVWTFLWEFILILEVIIDLFWFFDFSHCLIRFLRVFWIKLSLFILWFHNDILLVYFWKLLKRSLPPFFHYFSECLIIVVFDLNLSWNLYMLGCQDWDDIFRNYLAFARWRRLSRTCWITPITFRTVLVETIIFFHNFIYYSLARKSRIFVFELNILM